jgi:hypothetical protein
MEENNNAAQTPVPPAPQKESPSIVGDFINFKINIFPMIIKFFYVLGSIACIVLGLKMWPESSYAEETEFILPFCLIFLGPIVLHMLLELTMLPFIIVDLLREIRDRLPKE